MLRSILVRFLIPTAAAVSMLAFFVVPYADKLSSEWFREDADQRAQVLAESMRPELAQFLADDDFTAMGAYLAGMTADERLLGVVICAANGVQMFRTERTPDVVSCWLARDSANRGGMLIQRDKPLEVSRFALTANNATQYTVLLAQDLSFIERRRSAARNFVLAAAGVVASVVALFLGFAFWLLLRRWIKMLVGDIRALRFLDDAESGVVSLPVLREVRTVLRKLEHTQRLEIDFHENWTPQALKQVIGEYMESPQVLVVSNREPYLHQQTPSGPEVQVPASGMVTALEPIVRACSGTWIAHGSGSADREVVDRHDHVRVPPDDPSYTLRRVWLSAEEEQGFYYGFSNEGLWPLCHLAYVRPAFREPDWRRYLEVNDKFAAVVAQESNSAEPLVLIQDFHFALLPQLIRRRKPKATIALFWHIPWPNAETFGICPWKHEMLTHMLAADILGFHTRYHCQNFLATVDRFVECQIDHEHMTVTFGGHTCRVAAYPISIEWPPRWLANMPEPAVSSAAVRQRYKLGADVRIGLGVERWDFTKGIVERFLALEQLLESEPRHIGKLALLQVAAPSRSQLPAYKALQEQTLSEAARINARFGNDTWQPIVLIGEHQEPKIVFELFRAVDFCIVNSLHDGMNLVAKEFIASRDDEDGVLILSTFTGASRELPEALLVNPFDVAETAAAIRQALEMPRQARRDRMKLMRRTVKENNVYRWAGRMLLDAAAIRQRRALLEVQ